MNLKLVLILVLSLLLVYPVNAYSFSGTYTNLEGNSTSFSSYSGKITMIEAFQTECRFCRDPEHRDNMNLIYSEYRTQVNFLLISVFGSDTIEEVRNFISEFSVSWNAGLDSNNVIMNTFGITGTPTTLILDEGGSLIQSWIGHQLLGAYTSVLNEHVEEPVDLTQTATETENNDNIGGGGGPTDSIISRLFRNPFFLGTIVLFVALSIFFRSFGKEPSP